MQQVRELIPNPNRTYEEWERFTHADVERLSDRELLVELWQVQNGLANQVPDPDDWLWERWEVLSDRALLVELWRVQNGLANQVPDPDSDWLWERWEALSRELAKRRRQNARR